MNRLRAVLIATIVCSLICVGASAQRRTVPHKSSRTTTPTTKTARRTTTTNAASPTNTDARLTGLFRLDANTSADPSEVARRVAASLPPDEQRDVLDDLSARLNSPPQIAIQRRGRSFDIASTRAPRITFDADGQTYTERAADGHTVRTRAVVYGDSLMVSSRGSLDDEFSVNFDSLDGGRRLRVTRRIYEPRLSQPVVVQSFYERVSTIARFSIYGEPVPASVAEETARNAPRRTTTTTQPQTDRDRAGPPDQTRRQTQPPVIRREEPPRPYDTGFYIGENTRFVGTLNNDLDTSNSREGQPFTLTVREPQSFAGATIEGRVARIERGGQINGRAGMTLEFQRIVLRDGRTADFAGYIEGVRSAGGDEVRVDNEARGNIESRTSQTSRTEERAALGAAIGAIIGAIADGGKGAAIGAAVGAGAGVGSVYVQGRDDLTLPRGTEIALRTTRR
ncbi:MAG: hypothetical protein QOE33_362 [Acidobacteriota bacterium]|nr:hypothetical protein [Acidobacteriota bacterium]